MKSIDALKFPEDCRYTPEHVWVRVDGDELVVGISDFAQDQLGELAFVDMPAPGDALETGGEFGTVESVKSVNQLFVPVAGEVTGINETLESTPTLINVAPYGDGWIVRMRPHNMADVEALLTSTAYTATLA